VNRWQRAILEVVAESPQGQADLQRIYAGLQALLQLSPEHLRPTRYGGRPAYQHQVRSHVTDLCQVRQLEHLSRGFYGITRIGRLRLSSDR
jgi:hypothetical protein